MTVVQVQVQAVVVIAGLKWMATDVVVSIG